MAGKQGGAGAGKPVAERTLHSYACFCLYIQSAIVYNLVMPLSIRNSEVEAFRPRTLALDWRRFDADDLAGSARAPSAHTRRAAAGATDGGPHRHRPPSAALPELDRRSPEEIIGYDEHGLPK